MAISIITSRVYQVNILYRRSLESFWRHGRLIFSAGDKAFTFWKFSTLGSRKKIKVTSFFRVRWRERERKREIKMLTKAEFSSSLKSLGGSYTLFHLLHCDKFYPNLEVANATHRFPTRAEHSAYFSVLRNPIVPNSIFQSLNSPQRALAGMGLSWDIMRDG